MGKEVYISCDIESDGPIPGPHSMLSMGAAAFDASGELLSTFEANLLPLEGATGHPDTMKWWETQAEAWAAATCNQQKPEEVMQAFAAWVEEIPGTPVFVGYPAGFDFMFVYWYLIRFWGRSPFSFSAIDMKTYAMAVLRKDFRQTTKKTMPRHWFAFSGKHTHKALDDAIEQGSLFIEMLKDNLNRKG